MRKKLFVFVVFMFNIVLTVFSQTNDLQDIDQSISNSSSMKHNAFSFGLEQIFNNGKANNGFNINYEIFIAKNISLSYTFGFGVQIKGTSFHTTLGLAGLYYGLQNISKWGDKDNQECSYYYGDDYTDCSERKKAINFSYLWFLAILPEGINVYLYQDEHYNLISYFDLLGFEYRDDKSAITSNFGLKFGIKFGQNTYIEPKFGLKLNFAESESVITWGVNIKILF